MEATLAASVPIHGGRSSLSRHRISMKPHFYSPKTLLRFPASRLSRATMAVSSTESNPLRAAASGAVVLAALLSAAFRPPLARADPSAATPPAVEVPADTESDPSVASQLLRSLLFRKLESGDDSEALAAIGQLISAHPDETEWKLLAARLFRETGEVAESRRLHEEILAVDPLSFEALFENAVLLDRCGEGDAAIERLEQELYLAKEEQPEKVARGARLIMAQMEFLQKKPEAALSSYEELAKEDPDDYRPYFCQGVICSSLNRNEEAREKFSKYHELLSLRKLN
ncbi:protein SLOW GREEN 1, chloroplastic-like [Zingiber officinale]|uniref:protein SLOW GREEN 1, chloroplastic-like n=1 Tax=Zingiber officinale TaxID=94328 RepID=UPI001C4CC9E4|nr:protein SLOW GREEN 1, chloroplastic-like [Zingiber officinale]